MRRIYLLLAVALMLMMLIGTTTNTNAVPKIDGDTGMTNTTTVTFCDNEAVEAGVIQDLLTDPKVSRWNSIGFNCVAANCTTQIAATSRKLDDVGLTAMTSGFNARQTNDRTNSTSSYELTVQGICKGNYEVTAPAGSYVINYGNYGTRMQQKGIPQDEYTVLKKPISNCTHQSLGLA